MDEESYKELNQKIREEKLFYLSRLDAIYARIILLTNYIEIIQKYKNEITLFKDERINYNTGANQLYEYIILEISSYYVIIKEYNKKSRMFPTLPRNQKIIFEFRNFVAHMDNQGKFKSKSEIVDLYEEVNLKIFEIIDDFENYHKKAIPLIDKTKYSF